MGRILLLSLGFLFGLFHLGTAYFGPLSGTQQPAIHLTLAILVGGLTLYLSSAGFWPRAFVLLILLLGVVSTSFVFYADYTRGAALVSYPGTFETVMAAALLVCLVVMTKRLLGWALPVIVVIFLVYPYVGHLLTDFQDQPFTTTQVVFQVYTYTEGIFGTPLRIAATYIAVFLIYGALLERTGGGQFFLNISLALFGKVRGGPAKVAVIGSAMFGSINGSAVANVVSTGSLTIPLMKKIGLRPHYAAAVESAASAGGQLAPPIMGASAFIMAQLIGVPYREVVIAAIIPAALYFWAVLVSVDFEAGRLGMAGLGSRELPSPWRTLREGWPHLVSPMVLIYLLVIEGRSPMLAGLYSVAAMLLVTLAKRSTRWSFREFLEGLESGAQTAVPVALATASAGVVIASLSLTGLGLRISGLLVDAAGGSLFVLLLMTMVSCIILGMGLPTVAAYLILAITIAPALVQLGVPPLASHLFIFYFGVISAITPPVALAAFAAAGVAGTDPMRTAFTSLRLAWIAVLVPFLFVYEPALIMEGEPATMVLAILSALIGVVAVVGAAQGYLLTRLNVGQRVAFAVGGGLLLLPGVLTDAPGYAIVMTIALVNFLARRSEGRGAAREVSQPTEGGGKGSEPEVQTEQNTASRKQNE